MTSKNYDLEAVMIAKVLCGLSNPSAELITACRATLPHPPTPGFPYAKEAADLIEILRDNLPRDQRREKIRAIGTSIATRGGFSAMQQVAYEVRWQFPCGEGDENGWHPALIDADWEGIAGWRW